MEKPPLFNEPSLTCPYCGQSFGVSVIKGAENRIREDAIKILLEKWGKTQRMYLSDDQNIAWLSGYTVLLQDADLSKYEALKMLRENDKKVEDTVVKA